MLTSMDFINVCSIKVVRKFPLPKKKKILKEHRNLLQPILFIRTHHEMLYWIFSCQNKIAETPEKPRYSITGIVRVFATVKLLKAILKP